MPLKPRQTTCTCRTASPLPRPTERVPLSVKGLPGPSCAQGAPPPSGSELSPCPHHHTSTLFLWATRGQESKCSGLGHLQVSKSINRPISPSCITLPASARTPILPNTQLLQGRVTPNPVSSTSLPTTSQSDLSKLQPHRTPHPSPRSEGRNQNPSHGPASQAPCRPAPAPADPT